MPCRLITVKPLPELMIIHCQLNNEKQTSVAFASKILFFIKENASDNVVCRNVVAISYRPRSVRMLSCRIHGSNAIIYDMMTILSHYELFVRKTHWSPIDWLQMLSLISGWTSYRTSWPVAGDIRHHEVHAWRHCFRCYTWNTPVWHHFCRCYTWDTPVWRHCFRCYTWDTPVWRHCFRCYTWDNPVWRHCPRYDELREGAMAREEIQKFIDDSKVSDEYIVA